MSRAHNKKRWRNNNNLSNFFTVFNLACVYLLQKVISFEMDDLFPQFLLGQVQPAVPQQTQGPMQYIHVIGADAIAKKIPVRDFMYFNFIGMYIFSSFWGLLCNVACCF